MVCSLESACACVPRCGLAGERALRWLFQLAGLVVALAFNPLAAPVRGAGPADPVVSPLPPAFPRQGLALENPGRGERSLISLDPVAARIVAGTWTMPAQDEMVTFRNGQVRRWQPVQATPEGTFDVAGRDSYLAVQIGSEDERILMLEASGHVLVYLNGEPRVGDPNAHGYVRLPFQLRKGPNTFLFQAGRDHRIAARLRAPAAPAVLNPGDVTAPDLIVDEPVNAEASIVVIDASQRWTDGLEIVSQLPGGDLSARAFLLCRRSRFIRPASESPARRRGKFGNSQ